MLLCAFIMNILTLTTINIVQISRGHADEECQVLVSEPWPEPYLFVPVDSQTVLIDCTATNESPLWLVDLGNDSSPVQHRTSDPELSMHGVYDSSPVDTSRMPYISRLLINNTSVNNETKIFCHRRGVGVLSTTLLVIEPSTFALNEANKNLNSINISWIQQPQSSFTPDIDAFSLEISHGANSQILPLSESHYMFNAPKGAPPCEVYNFSILNATYVGATYTGAACSIPSPVFSTMLPSLPNISRMDSSLEYALTKQKTSLALYISFEPASYCEDYPVMNYTLEVDGTQNEKILESVFVPSAENFSVNDDLSENTVYSFRIHVANTVGVVSTNDRQFYTTDVQVVTATLIEGVNASTIQCEFIGDSNAAGCTVVLTTINGQKVYYNLTKNQSNNWTAIAITLEHPPSCYSRVEAFDIESNGSVGSLAVPGHIVKPSQAPCTPETLPVKPSSSGAVLEAWIIAVISAALVIMLLFAVVIVIVGSYKSKKSQERVLRWPCMCQCSANAQIEVGERIQVVNISEDQHLPDKLEDDTGESITAAGGMKTACSDMPTNCQLEEPAALYSEIASTSKLREHTTPGGGGGKNENVYSEPGSKGPPTKRGKASVPLEEKSYDQPVGAIERTPGDGADYSRTSYCQQTSMNDLTTANCHGAQYSTLDKTEDHIYFTLEPDRPRHNIIPSPTCTSPQTPFIPDTQGPPPPATTSVSPPPIYQEITEISSRRGGSATKAVTANGDSNTPLSSVSPPHVQKSCSVQSATDK